MAKRVGEVFCAKGYVTPEQVERALDVQSKLKPHQLLGQILLNEKAIDATQAQLLSYCQKCLLLDMVGRINSTLDLESLLFAIMEAAQVIMEAEVSSLFLRDQDSGELIIAVPTGPARAEISGIRIPPERGFCGWVATHGKPLIVSDPQADPRFFGEVSSGFRTRNVICVPLNSSHGQILGVLQACNKRGEGGFTEADIPLFLSLADQAAIALERARLQKESLEKQLLEKELALAAEIQKGFWPSQIPSYPGIGIAAFSEPATHIGGDYYDFIPVGEDRCALVIGDISGKGIPAALLMATLRAALRAQVAACSSVEETVYWVNDVLVTDTPLEKFATLFVGLLDCRRLELTYVNAGHNPPLLYDPRDGELKRLSIGGLIIGVFAGARFESGRAQLRPGQVLVAYTDGVTEAENTNAEMFDEERLVALVRQHANDEAEVLNSHIQKAIVEFSLGTSQHDDITVFVVKVADR
jgi:sigma-B regulation protein RsbU (phosphoserine phosphatase)